MANDIIPTIAQLEINGNTYDILDANTRDIVESLKSSKANATALADVEGMTADRKHPVGDNFMFNGDYVQAIVAIAAGDAITESKVIKTTMTDKIARVWDNTMVYRSPVTANFDNYRDAGVYRYAGNEFDGVRNKPESKGSFIGLLLVIQGSYEHPNNNSMAVQLYIASNMKAFYRFYGPTSG